MELRAIPGIGDKTAIALNKAGITTVHELLTTFPRTYRTYRANTVDQAKVGEWVILKGTLTRPISRHTYRTSTQISTFWDTTGSLTLRWFNMPYITRSVSPTNTYVIKGIISEFKGKKQLIAPQMKVCDEDMIPGNEIVPIYSARGSLKPWVLRQKIAQTLTADVVLDDPLNDTIREEYNLLPFQVALSYIHQPADASKIDEAVHRFAFQELYELQLSAIRSKNSNLKKGPALTIERGRVDAFLSSLPFEPTEGQRKAIAQIIEDLGKPDAMQRLLQGEVGSGKTIVAVAAAIATYTSGYRTLIMAPTQILAIQLYENMVRYAEPLGISVSLVTAKSKRTAETNIIVGTQALLNRSLPSKVGLVIVDEQHRFGVEQREKLATGETAPHLLQMTATPIPRSLAQTVFRHVDITRLTDIPKNRVPTKTFVVPESKREDSYHWIEQEIISQHNQAFIVVPLIEQAEENEVTPLKSLKELEVNLKNHFPNLNIDIMHGKMKEDEKLEHMQRFKDGITHLLVATSMIEVGIDIPEANIMVIEDAERFGLAQLHQLRGRVGRAGKQGYCLLFTNSRSPKAHERLSVFVREKDGAKLAEYDLESRGPGELFGTLQSGFLNLRLGSMYDEKLLNETYQAAKLTLGLDKKAGLS